MADNLIPSHGLSKKQGPTRNRPISELISDFIAQNKQTKIVIALSGGLDSSVLCHLLARLHPNPEHLKAVYINHGLQSASDEWALHCENFCDRLNIPFKEIKVQLDCHRRKGIEAVAREARYHALFQELEEAGCLVTGHHQRDQAETFLLALMRGSGLAGLSAMPKTRFQEIEGKNCFHCRPLLGVSPSELRRYAEDNTLTWIEDPSNRSLEFNRNYIRHKALPVLAAQWPKAIENIAHSASLQAESLELIDALAKQDMQVLDFTCGMIDLSHCFELSWVRQKNVIRFWLMNEVGIQVTQTILNWLAQALTNSNPQAHPKLKLPQSELRLHHKTLYFVTPIEFSKKNLFSKTLFDQLGLATKQFDWVTKQMFYQNAKGALFVRPISNTEAEHLKSLKKWFKNNKIPPWQRNNWPVFEVDNQVVAILGFWVAAD